MREIQKKSWETLSKGPYFRSIHIASPDELYNGPREEKKLVEKVKPAKAIYTRMSTGMPKPPKFVSNMHMDSGYTPKCTQNFSGTEKTHKYLRVQGIFGPTPTDCCTSKSQSETPQVQLSSETQKELP